MVGCMPKWHTWPLVTSNNVKVKTLCRVAGFRSAKFKKKKTPEHTFMSFATFTKCLFYAMHSFRCSEEYQMMNYGSLPSHRISSLEVCHLYCNSIIFFIFHIICSQIISCDFIASLRHLYKLFVRCFSKFLLAMRIFDSLQSDA